MALVGGFELIQHNFWGPMGLRFFLFSFITILLWNVGSLPSRLCAFILLFFFSLPFSPHPNREDG